MTKEEAIKLAGHAVKENKFVDFKSEFDPTSALSWCEIVKDLVAMANTGGGVIVFGVNDDASYSTFDRKLVLGLDPAQISEKVSRYLDTDFTEFEQFEVNRGRKKLACIYVSPTSLPYVFSKNGVQYLEEKNINMCLQKVLFTFVEVQKVDQATLSLSESHLKLR